MPDFCLIPATLLMIGFSEQGVKITDDYHRTLNLVSAVVYRSKDIPCWSRYWRIARITPPNTGVTKLSEK
jgi:hypothetical protein